MYDYDRRPTFDLTLHMGYDTVNGSGVALLPKTKLFVAGRQLGLISSVELKVGMASLAPRLRVGVLEGFSKEAWSKGSDRLRQAAVQVVSELRQFPWVDVVCPEYIK